MITWPVDFYGFVAFLGGKMMIHRCMVPMGWQPILRESQLDWYTSSVWEGPVDNDPSTVHSTQNCRCQIHVFGKRQWRECLQAAQKDKGRCCWSFHDPVPTKQTCTEAWSDVGRDVAVSEKRGMLYHLYTSKTWRIESENDQHWSTIALCSDNPVLVFSARGQMTQMTTPPHCRFCQKVAAEQRLWWIRCSSPFSQVGMGQYLWKYHF